MAHRFHGCSRCDGINNRWPQRLCHDCHAAYQRDYRAKHPTPYTGKVRARAIAGVLRRRGKIPVEPCWRCGDPKAEMHHPDYARPRVVVWLCTACHGWWEHGTVQKVALDRKRD